MHFQIIFLKSFKEKQYFDHYDFWTILTGGGSYLPKFKFSIEFPIGLHVILQLQMKKNSKLPNILCEKLF